MGLVMKEKICLTTHLGESEIQLLFGDITQLPKEDSVDFLFVSAFPGDYAPLSGTLIGALKQNLGLVVGHLAQEKAMDLRLTFNCWLSKPLPEDLPYKRLVCFERINRFETLPDQISGVFRAMMAVFNNQETSVITPLLASGDQGHSETVVLKAIVRAACHWIQAGLPLKCLKIVVYTRDPHSDNSFHQELVDCFTALKNHWEQTQTKEVIRSTKKFDVCLSYSEGDEELAKEICTNLEEMETGIVIHRELFVYNHKAIWQEQIFNVMVDSRKIVAVLTPNYVGKSECLEQFNMALCCNRLTGADVLYPFYMQTVEALPSYMTLIQYTECRVRKEGEKAEEKILSACTILVKEIEKDKSIHYVDTSDAVSEAPRKSSASTVSSKPSESGEYDIFISYAHKSPDEANKLYENLLDIESDVKVFLDRSELRAGNSWQETLYEAVDKAKVVVAFISKSYMQSAVCQDEYNIALARYMSMDGIYFLPLLTEGDLTELPAMFAAAPLVDISDLLYEEDRYIIAEAPIKWLEAQKKGQPIINRFCQVQPTKTRLSYVTADWRSRNFRELFDADKNKGITLKATTQPKDSPKTVAISCVHNCYKQAAVLAHLLRLQSESRIDCEFLTPHGTELQTPKMQLLDIADFVVVLVSDEYLDSIQHRHELHIALCRQRASKEKRILYLIETNHIKPQPVYTHLLHYSVNLEDEMWIYLARWLKTKTTSLKVQIPGWGTNTMTCSGAEYEALHAAALDIHRKLMSENPEAGSEMPTNIVNLVKLMGKGQDSVPVSECLEPFSILRNERQAKGAQPNVISNQLVKEYSFTSSHLQDTNRKKSQIVRTSRSCQIL